MMVCRACILIRLMYLASLNGMGAMIVPPVFVLGVTGDFSNAQGFAARLTPRRSPSSPGPRYGIGELQRHWQATLDHSGRGTAHGATNSTTTPHPPQKFP
jgi:hypothetical protein